MKRAIAFILCLFCLLSCREETPDNAEYYDLEFAFMDKQHNMLSTDELISIKDQIKMSVTSHFSDGRDGHFEVGLEDYDGAQFHIRNYRGCNTVNAAFGYVCPRIRTYTCESVLDLHVMNEQYRYVIMTYPNKPWRVSKPPTINKDGNIERLEWNYDHKKHTIEIVIPENCL